MKKTVITLLAGLAAVISAGEITLAENGQAKAGIVIPANAKPIVRFAAGELAEHLKKMTGAEFKISRNRIAPFPVSVESGIKP